MEPLLIDVRTKEEYDERHADGAINIPVGDIALGRLGVLGTTPKDTSIEVYCRSGGRSERAKEMLESLGYAHVINRGGLEDVENASPKISLGRRLLWKI